MTVLRHTPGTEEVAPGLWKPVCGCGWQTKGRYESKQSVAQAAAEQHAALKGCGKKRMTEHEAKQAVLDARIARGLGGSNRRQEDRAYRCPDCPGEVWHLTSQRKNSRRFV